MAERRYRDPVHNIISLSSDVPEDELLIELIDSAEFQRLRRIKQLGLALYTYQGAEHSRFTHCLGVMHLMTRVLDRLRAHHYVSEEARLAGRCAAMLHDLGHGPFSHVMEKVTHERHEQWTQRILFDPEAEVHQILSAFDSGLPQRIADVLEHQYSPPFISQLVSSQLDCDRFDYLLRDSLMTGAKYGIYDLEWILNALEIDPVEERIYVSHKGLYAVEEYLQARYYMFRQVYFHRTLRAAEAVLLSILKRAIELRQSDKLDFYIAGSALEKLLLARTLSTGEYLDLDDHDMMFHVKQWRRSQDPVLSDLSRRFLARRLFKTVDVEVDGEQRHALVKKVREMLARRGWAAEYYLIVDSASDLPYYGYYRPEEAEPKARIYVESSPNSSAIKEITEASAVVRGMHGYEIHRLCFPEEVFSEVTALVRSE